MKRFVPLLVVALLILLLAAVPASAGTPTLRQLARTVSALQKKVNAQAQTITALKAKVADQQTKLTDAASLLAIAPYVSLHAEAMNGVTGPSIVFQGANVHVRSTSSEDDGSGLGNLIVGWNGTPASSTPSDFRSGCNNLVCGDWNGFSGYGGFVAGFTNQIAGDAASICGGENNRTSAECAVVLGGNSNVATALDSVVCGGALNTASGDFSVVGGGNYIEATGAYGWAHP